MLIGGEGEGLGVAEPDKQGSGEARALSNGDGVDGVVSLAGVFESLSNNGHNRAKVFARSELGDDTSEGLVGGDLRIDDVGDQLFAGANHGGGGFVARRFDAEDVTSGTFKGYYDNCGRRGHSATPEPTSDGIRHCQTGSYNSADESEG